MYRLVATSLLILSLTWASYGQDKSQKVFTSDIDNFWQAYDSIQTTTDSLKQLSFIQSLYIDKGTEGLITFMEVRNYSAELWVDLINQYPKFWTSIRPNTLSVKAQTKEIEKSIIRLKELYPELSEAKMYFTVGGLRSGGTLKDHQILIGTEIATGTASTDVSEFPTKWLEGVFKEQSLDNIISLNIHEYVHTQQKGEGQNLLSNAIQEGSCDFVTELVMGKPMPNNYIQYGRKHEKELKEKFKNEMFSTDYSNWLYNGGSTDATADLGYFMGYAIAKSFYKNAEDKKQAIKQIIELDYADSSAVEAFLAKSKYYTEPIDKVELVKTFEGKRPYVVRLEPFTGGDSLVDVTVKELKIVFSAPMNVKGYSINHGQRGKKAFPVVGVNGFSEDMVSFTVKVDLKPNQEYEFVLAGRGFRSADGFPLKPYKVKFRTK